MTPSTAPDSIRSWDWSQIQRLCLAETRRVLGRNPAAEDAAQEALLRVWRQAASCRQPEAPDAWIRQIARNEALRALSVHRNERPDEQGVADRNVPCLSGGVHIALDLRRALAALDLADRELLLLRYWGDLTQSEAAARLGLAEGTVKVRLHRSRHRLRAALESSS